MFGQIRHFLIGEAHTRICDSRGRMVTPEWPPITGTFSSFRLLAFQLGHEVLERMISSEVTPNSLFLS